MKKILNAEMLEKIAGGWTLMQYYCAGEAVIYNGDRYNVERSKFSFKYGWVYDLGPLPWDHGLLVKRYNVPQDQLIGDSD